jgi:hypothetical protein
MDTLFNKINIFLDIKEQKLLDCKLKIKIDINKKL